MAGDNLLLLNKEAGSTKMPWHSVPFEQENQDPAWSASKLPGFYESLTTAAPPTYPPFQFHGHRSRIDWRVLHGIDVDEVVSDPCPLSTGSSCTQQHTALQHFLQPYVVSV